MSDNQVNNLLGVTMDKIKQMVDVNTVIGDPVTTPDGTTVIPVSRVSYGFASGGSDLPSKAQPSAGLFAGGSGAGITISPIAFLTIHQGNVRVLQIEPYLSSVDRALEKVPDVVDKVTALFQKEDRKEEPLPQERVRGPAVWDRSPNAQVRRKYRRAVLRSAKEAPPQWASPQEIETRAGLEDSQLHRLYEKARYSQEGCTSQESRSLKR